jgi:hypothetical protein
MTDPARQRKALANLAWIVAIGTLVAVIWTRLDVRTEPAWAEITRFDAHWNSTADKVEIEVAGTKRQDCLDTLALKQATPIRGGAVQASEMFELTGQLHNKLRGPKGAFDLTDLASTENGRRLTPGRYLLVMIIYCMNRVAGSQVSDLLATAPVRAQFYVPPPEEARGD